MSAITKHWESMARPVVHGETERCPAGRDEDSPYKALNYLHYWAETTDGVRCMRCGYSERLTDGV